MYRAMGLSEEDIAVLERAESLCNLADILPEDPKTAFDKLRHFQVTLVKHLTP